jgi:PEP-CTERM motif
LDDEPEHAIIILLPTTKTQTKQKMKKTLTIIGLAALAAISSNAQGLVSIANSSSTYYIYTNGVTSGRAGGSGATAYYYELLVSANTALAGTTANQIYGNSTAFSLWSDSGVTGISGTAGLNSGKLTSTSTSATGWSQPSQSAVYDNPESYLIVGWSANYGTSWSAVATAIQQGTLANGGYYGVSAAGLNYAGGNGLPSVNLWGNQTSTSGYGLSSGFTMNLVTVAPEPSTMALAGLGGAALLMFRRRK